MGELIAILSGKGGTGKTSVCAGLATALADSGLDVLCIDCDIGLRNLDISLGISQLGAISFLDVSSGTYPLEAAAIHPVYPDLHFLTAPMNCTADSIDRLEFSRMLDTARNRYHYVLLDAPELLSPAAAEMTARTLLGKESEFFCDGGADPMGSAGYYRNFSF